MVSGQALVNTEIKNTLVLALNTYLKVVLIFADLKMNTK